MQSLTQVLLSGGAAGDNTGQARRSYWCWRFSDLFVLLPPEIFYRVGSGTGYVQQV